MKSCRTKPLASGRGLRYTFAHCVECLWQHLADRVVHLAAGHACLPDTDMRLCVNILGAHLMESESVKDELVTVDDVRTYAKNMISVAVGITIPHTALLDEAIATIVRPFHPGDYPALIHGVLLSNIPCSVVGSVLLPKVVAWGLHLLGYLHLTPTPQSPP